MLRFLKEWRQFLKEGKGDQYQIFCDMDGVLVDFDNSVAKYLNELLQNADQYHDRSRMGFFIKKVREKIGDREITPKDFSFHHNESVREVVKLMFELLRSPGAGDKYWAEMGWLVGGQELWESIKEYNPIILTAPIPGSDESKNGKVKWCQKHLGDVKVIVESEKEKYAKYKGKVGILIDDRQKNIDKFKGAGGKTVTHKNHQDSINKVKQYLGKEIRNDVEEVSDSLRAIFMAGSPGAGKSTVLKEIGAYDKKYVVINTDHFFEKMLDDAGLSKNLAHPERPIRQEQGRLFAQAAKQAKQLTADSIENRDNIIVDGTAGNYKTIEKNKNILEEKGYDVAMIYVDVEMETSLQRNELRGQQGGRSVRPSGVESSWRAVNRNKEKYEELFGSNFIYVRNDDDKQRQEDIPTAKQKFEEFSK
tara:strand:+ start:4345 stop:5604 length:1260 start_codon:yes stop_codon:yes gene_type:complete